MDYEFIVPPARLTRIEKAWYKRIFSPANYCRNLVHSLKHNDIPD